MIKMFIKPAVPGSVVLQPDRDMAPLAQEGEWVVSSMHWHRAIANGDVVMIAEPPKTPAPEKKA